jgi:hypothetical protein
MGNFEEQLQTMKTHPGFIAALDQSGGSTPGALRAYGLKEDAWSKCPRLFPRPLSRSRKWRSRLSSRPHRSQSPTLPNVSRTWPAFRASRVYARAIVAALREDTVPQGGL